MHNILMAIIDNKLYLCPAGKDKPIGRVLDAGTGTGVWAVEFGDEHPESQVVGVDLSPIQPSLYVPAPPGPPQLSSTNQTRREKKKRIMWLIDLSN